jgi:hypothetical protein
MKKKFYKTDTRGEGITEKNWTNVRDSLQEGIAIGFTRFLRFAGFIMFLSLLAFKVH